MKPTFCPSCGNKLRWEESEDSWSAIAKCSCGAKWEVTYGDYMGGSRDELRQL